MGAYYTRGIGRSKGVKIVSERGLRRWLVAGGCVYRESCAPVVSVSFLVWPCNCGCCGLFFCCLDSLLPGLACLRPLASYRMIGAPWRCIFARAVCYCMRPHHHPNVSCLVSFLVCSRCHGPSLLQGNKCLRYVQQNAGTCVFDVNPVS